MECLLPLCLALWSVLPFRGAAAMDDFVPRFGVYERTFKHAGHYTNPHVEVWAIAQFVAPEVNTSTYVPLFWDGDKRWKFRFSPDRVGRWAWTITSNDEQLHGRRGRLTVMTSGRHGGVRPMKESPYHFQRQDGSPFWFLGDTAWALYTDNEQEQHDRASVKHYLDTRAKQGFNVLHSMLLSEAGWGNAEGPPFLDVGAEEINPAYWKEVDARVRLVNRHGITAGLVLAWGDKKGVEPFAWSRFASDEARYRYARYIGARYGAFDVFFIVSGEWHAEVRQRRGVSREQVRREFIIIGQALSDGDAHDRMVSIHPMTAEGSVREFVGAPWMSFGDYQQNYDALHARILKSRRFDRPVVNSEYAYFLRDANGDGVVDKPNSFQVDDIRHASWDIVMAGGYLVTGFGTTYFGGHRDPGPFHVDAEKNDIWESQVQHLRQLFESLQWWTLCPADEAIASDIPRSQDRRRRVDHNGRTLSIRAPPATAYWLLADAGDTYVAYIRGCGAPVRITAEPGNYVVRQFDPREGRFEELGIAKVDGEYAYSTPDERDWLIILRRSRRR